MPISLPATSHVRYVLLAIEVLTLKIVVLISEGNTAVGAKILL